MLLHDAVDGGQAQAGTPAFFLGGEIQFENLVLSFGGNAAALIANFCDYHVIFAAGRNRELASIRHGLDPVEHHVEDGLLYQVRIHADRQGLSIDRGARCSRTIDCAAGAVFRLRVCMEA